MQSVVPSPEKPDHRNQSPEPDYADIRHELQTNKHVTLQLLWEEYREKNPNGYRYSRFCDLYRRWLRKQEVVLRHEHRAGEKYLSTTPATLSRFTLLRPVTRRRSSWQCWEPATTPMRRPPQRRAWPIGSAPTCAPSSFSVAFPRSLSPTI